MIGIAVPLNTIFGVFAAFSLTRFEFPGKSWILTIIDSPFSVSPVISGLIFILLFGRQGWFGPWLEELDFKIVFNTPGLVIATIFITLPFVARELIPLLDATGMEEEEAGLLLGASPIKVFLKIVAPGIKYGLLYGIILCNARAMENLVRSPFFPDIFEAKRIRYRYRSKYFITNIILWLLSPRLLFLCFYP